MAKVTDQNIPSEILDSYTKLLLPAKADGHVGGTVEKRPPFKQPTWGGIYENGATPQQIIVRQIFRNCVDCFNIQPLTGGVEPPEQGPRNRSWWHAECPVEEPDYYRYFMQQTLNKYFTGICPDWCWIDKDEYKSEGKGYAIWRTAILADSWIEAWGKALTEDIETFWGSQIIAGTWRQYYGETWAAQRQRTLFSIDTSGITGKIKTAVLILWINSIVRPYGDFIVRVYQVNWEPVGAEDWKRGILISEFSTAGLNANEEIVITVPPELINKNGKTGFNIRLAGEDDGIVPPAPPEGVGAWYQWFQIYLWKYPPYKTYLNIKTYD